MWLLFLYHLLASLRIRLLSLWASLALRAVLRDRRALAPPGHLARLGLRVTRELLVRRAPARPVPPVRLAAQARLVSRVRPATRSLALPARLRVRPVRAALAPLARLVIPATPATPARAARPRVQARRVLLDRAVARLGTLAQRVAPARPGLV